jgi:hypothetical protein
MTPLDRRGQTLTCLSPTRSLIPSAVPSHIAPSGVASGRRVSQPRQESRCVSIAYQQRRLVSGGGTLTYGERRRSGARRASSTSWRGWRTNRSMSCGVPWCSLPSMVQVRSESLGSIVVQLKRPCAGVRGHTTPLAQQCHHLVPPPRLILSTRNSLCYVRGRADYRRLR